MDKDKQRDFGIALSGGGHRASLFALGALLYLVDSRTNERVATICSVSGGSITNAFVAQECDFGTVGQDEFDRVAARLARVVTTKPIVSLSSWVVRLYMVGLLSVLGITILSFILPRLLGSPSLLLLWAAGALILAFGVLLLLRGTVVAWLLGRAFFVDERGQPSRLGSLRNQTVGHVLCATDLASAAPFYFLCGKEWAAYSARYGFAREGAMKLRTAVRASAALPGAIPPKLFLTRYMDWAADFDPASIPLEEGETFKPDAWERPPWFLFLADGGVWNNLGTQYFERDQEPDLLFRARRDVSPSPSLPNNDPGKLIIIDGSAEVAPTRSWDLVIPLWAEVRALSRVMTLLYTNTVRPRMRQIGETKRAHWRWGDVFDPDWDIPKIGISISFIDNPQSGRIYTGLGPETQHYQVVLNRSKGLDEYWSRLPENICSTLKGFPATYDLRSFCAKEKTHLSNVNGTRAAALLVAGYLFTMLAMHETYGTSLIQPFPGEQRFKRFISTTPS